MGNLYENKRINSRFKILNIMYSYLKILNILFIILCVYQHYNLKISYRYEISDGTFFIQHKYEKKEISIQEYNKIKHELKTKEKKLLLYDIVNKILFILNILFVLYWTLKFLLHTK